MHKDVVNTNFLYMQLLNTLGNAYLFTIIIGQAMQSWLHAVME